MHTCIQVLPGLKRSAARALMSCTSWSAVAACKTLRETARHSSSQLMSGRQPIRARAEAMRPICECICVYVYVCVCVYVCARVTRGMG
jgi:hypothetical protein